MIRIFKDIQAKASIKAVRTRYRFFAVLKTLLDVNVWIVIIYRLSSIFSKLKLYPVSKLFWLFNRIIFTVDIDPRADLAGGLMLVHGMNIVIGHEVRSQGKLRIFQGATVGGNSGKSRVINGEMIRQPIFYDDVTVGINSCVLGPVTIGENSIVGTGAIVTKDVPSNSTIVSVNKVIA
ncbi:serine O-acetyltransferase [Carboxylicivirga sp. RSCT41]|uniref:serine O-acetyltransferase n=1 Tax=Carboxylicivirga agarovorans TaxID=3417570 RepID=UPI003D349C1F